MLNLSPTFRKLIPMVLIAMVAITFADVPKIVNYQGKLVDASGLPQESPVSMGFSLWNNATAGDSLWGQTFASVDPQHGIFAVELDFSSGWSATYGISDMDAGDTWIQVRVDGVTLLPREILASSFHAFNVADGSVTESKLKMTVGATAFEDGHLLSYDDLTGGFTWVDPGDVGGVNSLAEGDNITLSSATGNITIDVSPQGAGSSLDADLLDGLEAADFALTGHNHNHDDLNSIQGAAPGVTYGHISDGDQTLAGIKTFSSFPVTPSAEPVDNYQVANKKYVDDAASTAVTDPAGNDGNVQFNNSGVFGGSDNLFWDDANSRLAIGNTAPAHPLHVTGNARFDVEGSRVAHFGTDGTELQLLLSDPHTANPKITFGNGAGTATIETQSNMGLNLDVLGTSTGSLGFKVRTDNGSGVLTDRLSILKGASSVNTAFTNTNVGIGTTTPSSRLDVHTPAGGDGTGLIVRSNFGSLNIWGGAASGLVMDVRDGNISGSGGDMYIRTGGTNRMFIDGTGVDAGNIGIATTSPSSELDVNGTIRANAYRANDGTDLVNAGANIAITEEADGSWTIALDGGGSTPGNTYTFTNCGQTGRTGPSQVQANAAYSGTSLDGEVTVTNGIQYWTVPAGVTEITIDAYGAQGGGSNGGLGAKMSGTFTVTPGEVLKVLVGQQGMINGRLTSGGGGSYVTRNDDTPLIIAGGGGGADASGTNQDGTALSSGQDGYAPSYSSATGGTGGNGGNSTGGTGHGGGGGGFYSNGSGSSYGFGFVNGGYGGDPSSSYPVVDGGFGGGGGAVDNTAAPGFWGGGAGGGYSGGGAACASGTGAIHRAGGGGSYNAGTDQDNATGTNTGHGYVVINSPGGGSSPLGDDLGNHIAEENLQMTDFWVSNDGDNEGVYVDATGNVGIGTSSPQSMLSLSPNNTISVATSDGSDDGYLTVTGGGAYGVGRGAFIQLSGNERASSAGNLVLSAGSTSNIILNASGSSGFVGIRDDNPNAQLEISGDGGADDLFMVSSTDAGNGDRFIVKNSGNVGIGTINPVTQLHTTGTVRFAGAGTPGAGKVLTSDADGDATWETPPTLPSDNVTGTGTAQQIAFWDGTNTITGNNNFTYDEALGRRLHITGNASNVEYLTLTNSSSASGAYGFIRIGQATGSKWGILSYSNTDAELSLQSDGSSSGGIALKTQASAPIKFVTSLSDERMRITGDGNVGIGTDSPNSELDVDGTIRANTYRANDGTDLINAGSNITVTEEANGSWTISSTGGSSVPPTNVLVLDEPCGSPPWTNPYESALIDLGWTYTTATDATDFNTKLLDGTDWDIAIYNNYNNTPGDAHMQNMANYISGGGKLIFSDWATRSGTGATALYSALGVSSTSTFSSSIPIYAWNSSHALYTTPNSIPTTLTHGGDYCGSEGMRLTVSTGTAVSGFTSTVQAGQAAVVVNSGGNAIFMGEVPFVFAEATLKNFLVNQLVYLWGGSGSSPGGGISSLNGQTGETQTFTDDANITITSAGDNHTLGWTGQLAVARGGTGIGSYTTNNYIRASGATTLEQRTPAQVLSDIGAAASSHTHGSYNRASSALSGATVFSDVVVSNGIVTGTSTRNLTAANIGAAASSHNHAATDITSGTLPVARGGTGLSSVTANNLLVGNGTSALNTVAPSGTDTYLKWNGSSYEWDTPSGGSTGPSETYTFTNCGQTGRTGPSQVQANATYSGTSLDGEVTVTSGIQYWTVPVTGTYTIEAYGAQGYSADASYSGGLGAYMSGEFSLTAGQVLKVLVGQLGVGTSGVSGSGGGGSFVTYSDNTPLLVAGGGGGTRTDVSQDGCDGVTSQYAVIGSGASMTSTCALKTTNLGQGGIVSSSSWGSAGGGFNTNGANDGSYGYGGSSYISGGLGGAGSSSPTIVGGFGGGGSGCGSNGGGGGGGYSGGDGGRVAGGGGSYISPSATLLASSDGANTGHGYVVITSPGGSTPGGGISSLNGQTGETQTFTDDANVTITSSSDNHTLGWTGQLSVARGGTGIGSYTTNNYIRASGATTLEQRTPAQVLSDIGAAATSHNHAATDITSGTLPIARGGTNASATPTAGAVAYGTGSAYSFTGAGTAGQVLTSGGTGAPTWETPSGGGGSIVSEYAESDGQSSTTSFSFQDKTTLSLPAGTYQITASAEVQNTYYGPLSSYRTECQLLSGSTVIGGPVTNIGYAYSNWNAVSWTKKLTLSSTTALKLQYRNVGSTSYTASIRNARIFALKLDGGGTTPPTGSETFNYTGSVQSWTVPTGVTSITVDAYGAQGGAYNSTGGLGGRMQATIAVTSGQTVYVYVGGQDGYNGGGAKGTNAGIGGGASDIRIGGTALSNRRVVAGGGGGAGNNCGTTQEWGGAGGGSTGETGWQCNTQLNYVGTGGTQFSGGTAGPCLSQSPPSENGALGLGGRGAVYHGGGGGGGYYGGGGGGYGGGGGGSNWSSGTILTNTQGVRSGNGQVIISW